jgi:hypothetical protein
MYAHALPFGVFEQAILSKVGNALQDGLSPLLHCADAKLTDSKSLAVSALEGLDQMNMSNAIKINSFMIISSEGLI